MTTVICDFMSDLGLEKLAEKLCAAKPEQFSHMFSHRRPVKSSNLSLLDLVDATLLYRRENLEVAFPGVQLCAVSLAQATALAECQVLFMSAIDRTMPVLESVHDQQRYFWDMVGYYIGFFKKHDAISSLLYDNTPHMPWDICLFYVAKLLDIKVLMLRRTGIRGYLYIDEDFRPGKTAWNFEYTGLNNPLLEFTAKDDFMSELNDLSFTKGQINGMWPEDEMDKKNLFRSMLDVLRSLGFQQLITMGRVVLLEAQNNTLGATEHTVQRSTFAGMERVGRLEHLRIHGAYLKQSRECVESYNKLVSDQVELDKPYVYFAMHFQPERTTLPEGLVYEDQVLAIRTIAEGLPEGWKVIVKEHPRQTTYDLRSMHFRTHSDYDRIKKIDNVVVVPSSSNQKDLVAKCALTATISGSVSWEGLLIGKPSLLFCENWHARCASTRVIGSAEDAKLAISELQKKNLRDIEADICIFVREIADSLINGALNENHLRMFFTESNKNVSFENLSSAILQRLN